MEVFFVRHGETDGNVARRHQHSETSLNEVGRAQVMALAPEIAALKPTHFISSTHLRAIETTRILAAACNLTPATSHAFEELARPDSLVGQRYMGVVTLFYVLRWFFGFKIPDGEGYQQFLSRILEGRRYLQALPNNSRVVVVSHAVFVNIFIEHLCLDTKMGIGQALRSFFKIFRLRNASIIHLHFTPGNYICGWTVIKR